MHITYHEIFAAVGGLLFIIIGIARRRERQRLIKGGKKTEGAAVWTSLLVAGICLLVFAAGVIIFRLNHS